MTTTKAAPRKTSASIKMAPHAAAPRFLSAGDRSRAICHECKAMRDIEYEYRSVPLEKTKVTVPNVLVGVCMTCQTTVSVPAQSLPRIKEARQRQMKEQNARIPLELEDRLNVMAYRIGARSDVFKGALCRYALQRVTHEPVFARLVRRCADSEGARGTPGARVKFRAEAELARQALAAAHDVGLDDLSVVLRGAILAIDALLATPKSSAATEHDLRLLAIGGGA